MTPPAESASHRRAPLPGILGRAGAMLYRRAIGRINRRFDRGVGVVTLDRPVISIGNLSTGGTGKTPLVMHTLRVLRDAGFNPCVAMRGYASREGKKSDEALEYSKAFPDLEIVAQANRTEGLLNLFATPVGTEVDCIVLDDGFQHRQIARTLDIIAVDASASPFDDALLPAGHLREPVDSVARADAIVITHAERVDGMALASLERRLREHAPRQPIAVARHAWTSVDVLTPATGADSEQAIQFLGGRRAFAVCAIGNPEAFLAGVRSATGQQLAGALVLADHDPYDSATIAGLLKLAAQSGASTLVTTSKDWSKLSRVRPDAWPFPVVRPRLAIRFDAGEDELTKQIIEAAETEPD